MINGCSNCINVPNQAVEKYILHRPEPLNSNDSSLNEETSKNDLVENYSGNGFQNMKIDEINKLTLNQTLNQEAKTGFKFEPSCKNVEYFESLSEHQAQDYTIFYGGKQIIIYYCCNHLPAIQEKVGKKEKEVEKNQEEEDEENAKEKKEKGKEEAIEKQKAEKEQETYNVNSEESVKKTLISLCDVFNENSQNIKHQKSLLKNGENLVGEINIDAEIIMELISYASRQGQNQDAITVKQAEDLDKIVTAGTFEQHKNCELKIKQKGYEDGIYQKHLKEVIGLDTIEGFERNFHPLFISADGQRHELLLKHRKVMRVTKPSPYQRFQKCMDLRRYFGGLPHSYECNLHKEENREPLWMQKHLYEYRLFLRTFHNDVDEEDSLKRLIKPGIKKESKPKQKGKKQPPLAKICRLCGQNCKRYVSSGDNVVIKLVSVYLPLVIIEGNAFPIGLCDKCDYSLALICSFMLTYLDCGKLEMHGKKCFTCRCETENLLSQADRKTMEKLADAFHGIHFGLGKFFIGGQKYLCNACRLSFELLESFREDIWLTNKVFEDGDERLYETECDVSKNQFTCELPPGFYSPRNKMGTKFCNSIDNCSVEPTIGAESYYQDDFEPRKYFLKKQHRRIIMKFFRKLRGFQYTVRQSFRQLQKLENEQKDAKKGGIISALKRGKYRKYELLPTCNNTSDEDETATKSLSTLDLLEQQNGAEINTSDENGPSLLNFFLGDMNTSLLAHFNGDGVLQPQTSKIESNSEDSLPSTSGTIEELVVAEVHPPSNNSKILTTSNDEP